MESIEDVFRLVGEQKDRALARRNTVAAERAALEAQRSADAAIESARTSRLALYLSAGALVVSILVPLVTFFIARAAP